MSKRLPALHAVSLSVQHIPLNHQQLLHNKCNTGHFYSPEHRGCCCEVNETVSRITYSPRGMKWMFLPRRSGVRLNRMNTGGEEECSITRHHVHFQPRTLNLQGDWPFQQQQPTNHLNSTAHLQNYSFFNVVTNLTTSNVLVFSCRSPIVINAGLTRKLD